jgi:hypothetical protein
LERFFFNAKKEKRGKRRKGQIPASGDFALLFEGSQKKSKRSLLTFFKIMQENPRLRGFSFASFASFLFFALKKNFFSL